MEWRWEEQFAEELDNKDILNIFRSQFYFPQHNGKNVLYFTGNSLGLQPKQAKEAIEQELEDWRKWGVEGHFKAKNPWYSYHEIFKEGLAYLTGSKPLEVTAMGTLTANLHFLLCSFYRPKGKRTKILYEHKAFPSDIYALQSQIKFHGLDPKQHLIAVMPDQNEIISTEQWLQNIENHKNELALVLLGGVNYYSGQRFEMDKIAAAAKKAGAIIGLDLAHAIGNVELQLHDWEIDFAVWCSYKYLNSGPGSVAGIFVHEKYAKDHDLPRLAGWWGYPAKDRFKMESDFIPAEGSDGWMLSNAPVFSMAAHKVSLDMFMEATTTKLFTKRDLLTGYLEFVIKMMASKYPKQLPLKIITPEDPSHRGSQLSINAGEKGRELYEYLTGNGVIADWREPDVIRMAPVPMYNSFKDIYEFGKILKNYAESKK